MDDYEDMPIDQFGVAMLKGMGWKPGEAIGLNKKGFVVCIHTHPFMYMYIQAFEMFDSDPASWAALVSQLIVHLSGVQSVVVSNPT